MANNRLKFILESQDLIVPAQCGFRKNRSSLDHLLNLEHDILSTFDKKDFLVTCFLDLERAYDMAWRRGILQKLYALGLRGNLPIFIQNFLFGRTFSVKVQDCFSTVRIQENGVPQGSVLSPTLFMILINDILPAPPRNLKYSLYADDVAIWHSSPNARFSASRVQLALDSLQEWSDEWGFKFSELKSTVVLFSRRAQAEINLQLHGNPIPVQTTTFFLGLRLDSRLNWKAHVKYLVNAYNKIFMKLPRLVGNPVIAIATRLLGALLP